jgi:hypothetical protein
MQGAGSVITSLKSVDSSEAWAQLDKARFIRNILEDLRSLIIWRASYSSDKEVVCELVTDPLQILYKTTNAFMDHPGSIRYVSNFKPRYCYSHLLCSDFILFYFSTDPGLFISRSLQGEVV